MNFNLMSITASAALREGNAARDRHDWLTAAKAYGRFLKAKPRNFSIHVQLGHMLKESGDLEAARNAYQHALQLNAEDADLLRWFGNLDIREGRYAEAVEKLRRSAELGEPEALSDLRHAHARLLATNTTSRVIGYVDDAIANTIFGWAVDPDYPETLPELEILVNEQVAARVTANINRPDLAATGGFGFKAQLDLSRLGGSATITVRMRYTGEVLQNSPMVVHVPFRAPLAIEARLEVVKSLHYSVGREIALLVTHSRTGAVKPHVLALVRALAKEGVGTLLIMVADRPATIESNLLDILAGAVVRENAGYDFACWAHALRLYPQAYAASVLFLVNDSIFGPADHVCFAAMMDRVRNSKADVVGLTESTEHRWHVQSYFLALKTRALSSLPLHLFFDGIRILPDKDAVIQEYETRFVPLLESTGNTVEVLFPSQAIHNPTIFGWRKLLDIGFPFVKMLLLRGEFPMADTADWECDLGEHGFDLSLLEESLLASTVSWSPQLPGFPLLARPHRYLNDDSSKKDETSLPEEFVQPLKIAFFGPWNYDNGLAAASRGLIAAIRQCDVRLNLHPIKVPFHIHKRLVPAVDVCDFVGPADIAIVHMNPDSWHLLTNAQRQVIAAARYRIGHWVWEMSHIPAAWRHNFFAVDRIWAPSAYCADLFTAESAVPVDVVPYTMPLTPQEHLADIRPAMLERLGLPAGKLLILYIFDGSSYLVRKNPAALVRAFIASGLASQNWSLVLKTKHLFDRAEEGRALEALVAKNPNIILLNAAISHAQMAELAAACDIYASPHCSEGFGLTIAEAMSAGKPVVVTDFGGSTEFVDATCGYPVLAHPWTLEQDFGHYTKGGTWARIDESALSVALRRAAAAVQRGDTAIPDAARARIAATLSYIAVSDRIRASFAAILNGPDAPPPPSPPLAPHLHLGSNLADADLGETMILVPLNKDLAPLSPRLGLDNNHNALPTDRDHWIVFAPSDAVLAPLFRSILEAQCEARPDVAIFYTDDVALGEETLGRQLCLKPGFDPDLLVAQDYIGVPLIVRASVLHELGGLDPKFGGAGLSKLLFQADALGMSIARIPTPLLALTGCRTVVLRDVRRHMIATLPSFAAFDIEDGLLPETLRLSRRFAPHMVPEVTIVVPTQQSAPGSGGDPYISGLLHALTKTDWPMERMHVLVGDDLSGESVWANRHWPFKLTRISTSRQSNEPFNYASKMNRLWRLAKTEHLVLMNDDVLPRDPGWLRALLTFSMDQGVGGVGARLLYPDDTIQHVGIAPLFGVVAHPWLSLPAHKPTYGDWSLVHRGWSAVTGAVFATRRSLLDQVNGFEERFTLEFNDIDLCLRLRALGYRIIMTPHAELEHVEKASRGKTLPPGEDVALFLERWHSWLAEDPSFHPMIRPDRIDLEPMVEAGAWYG